MSLLAEDFEKTIRDRRLFRRGQPILVAVSGGLDSMVLLQLMDAAARRNGWKLTVAHLNHKLRGKSSEADASLVRRTAKKLGWPAVLGTANVREIARRQKLSLEMAARKARHEFLARTAARLKICTVALAHHADDQLEQFFLRLFRGSGSQGLVGMQWRNPSPFDKRIELVRPLLGQSRATLAKYAAVNKVRFREDASNASLDIQRNRIRHELLPLVRKYYQPALESVITRVLDITGAEADLVTDLALGWLNRLQNEPEISSGREGALGTPPCEIRAHIASMSLAGDPSLRPSPLLKGRGRRNRLAKERSLVDRTSELLDSGSTFESLPVAVQRRAVQLQLLDHGIMADFDLVEQLRLKEDRAVCVSTDKLASGNVTRTDRLFVIRGPTGCVWVEKGEFGAFARGSAVVDMLNGQGEAQFDGIKVLWQQKRHGGQRLPARQANCEWFDADRVGRKILLRHWQPGDRFQPMGMRSPIKLQDFFSNQKVPRKRRHVLILAVSAGGEVFWVEGMRISERFKLTKATIRRLQWRWQRL